MKNMGHNLLHIGIGLIVLVIGIQLLWSVIVQFKAAIIIAIVVLVLVWIVRRFRNYTSSGGM